MKGSDGSDAALQEVVQLPCAARHTFHEDCARGWLSRNVTCPLCRVDATFPQDVRDVRREWDPGMGPAKRGSCFGAVTETPT